MKIGSITFIKDIRIGQEEVNCDMPHVFTNNNTQFIVEFNENEREYEVIKDFEDQIKVIIHVLLYNLHYNFPLCKTLLKHIIIFAGRI